MRAMITPAAIAAWREGDVHGLERALGIKPWKPTPWPWDLGYYGVTQGPCPGYKAQTPSRIAAWERAQELQAELYRLTGPPPAKLHD